MLKYKKGGLSDLAFLVIVASVIVATIFIVSAILEIPLVNKVVDFFIGRTLTAKLFVTQVDEGTKLNTFLVIDKGKGRYADLLAFRRAQGFLGSSEDVKKTLDMLDLFLLVKDETGKNIFLRGNVRELDGKFIDIALPGLKKGRLGIDVEI